MTGSEYRYKISVAVVFNEQYTTYEIISINENVKTQEDKVKKYSNISNIIGCIFMLLGCLFHSDILQTISLIWFGIMMILTIHYVILVIR